MRRVVYRVEGLDGSSGRQRVVDAVQEIDGVYRVRIEDGAVDVAFDERRTSGGAVAARIGEAGYEVLG